MVNGYILCPSAFLSVRFYYFYNNSSVGILLYIKIFIKACARFGQEPNHRLLFILNISVVWVIGKVE